MKIYTTTESGYRFNKIIFLSAIFVLIVGLFMMISIFGYEQHAYMVCEDEYCENPFATQEPVCQGMYCPPVLCEEAWCSQEYIPRGEYGKEPPAIYSYFKYIAFGMIGLAFLLNHFIHNRHKRFSVPTKRQICPEWMANLIRKAYPEFTNEIDLKNIKMGDDK